MSELPRPNTDVSAETRYAPIVRFDPGRGASVMDLFSGDGPYEGESIFAGERAVLLGKRKRKKQEEPPT